MEQNLAENKPEKPEEKKHQNQDPRSEQTVNQKRGKGVDWIELEHFRGRPIFHWLSAVKTWSASGRNGSLCSKRNRKADFFEN